MWFCDENSPRFVIDKPRPMLLGVARFAWDRQPHLRYFFRKTLASLSRPLGRVSPEGLERRPRQAHEPSDAMSHNQLLHLPCCTRVS